MKFCHFFGFISIIGWSNGMFWTRGFMAGTNIKADRGQSCLVPLNNLKGGDST